jgi:hypothetical protein
MVGVQEAASGASERGQQHPPFTTGHLVLLIGITLLAALLRLHRLGEWSLWVDEGHTYRDIVVPGGTFWSSQVRNYPLSYVMLRVLCWLGMPTSEGWLRLPFVFFGILSVPALCLLGRRLVGPRAALAAALLLAVSPWHIFWSQNARSYAMVLFFALMAASGFFNGLQRRSPPVLVAALGLSLIAGLCHPSAFILLGGLVCYGFFATRNRVELNSTFQKWLPAMILLLIAIVTVVLLPLLQHVHRAKPEFSLFHLTGTLAFFVRTPLIVAALGGILLLFDRGDRAAPFLLCWILVPALVLAVLATGVVKVTAQYAFYTLPAFCLLGAVVVLALAEGVASTGFRRHLLRIVPMGILLLDMRGQTYLYFHKYHGERPRWREAGHYVKAHSGDRKRIITTNGPSMRYYLDPMGFWKPGSNPRSIEVLALADFIVEEAGGGSEFMRDHVARARAEGVDLFVVLTEPEFEEMDPGGVMNAYLRERFLQKRRLPNWTGPKDMTVLVYHLRP